MNETLRKVDGRHELRMERRFAHPRERVWQAITEPDHLQTWFPARARYSAFEPGADIEFVFEGSDDVSTGSIIDVDPPRVFAFTWNGEVLRFDLEPIDDGTLMVFTQVFDDRPGAASFATGWTVCFDYMDAMLAGSDSPEIRWVPELHEEFVKRFGLDQGQIERVPNGWEVRFERQLTQPVNVAWAALTGASDLEPGGSVPPESRIEAFPARTVTVLEAGCLLAYAWRIDERSTGTTRLELQPGPGGGRLRLTQTGSGGQDDLADVALAAWRGRIEGLARDLSRMPRTVPN